MGSKLTRLLWYAAGAIVFPIFAVVLYSAASYPSAVKSFTTKTDGAGQTIFAAHINDIQDEIVAIEGALLNGVAHTIKPLTNNLYDLGTSSLAWKNLYVAGTTKFNGVTYTWPSADGTSGQVLNTNGSATLAWGSSGVDNRICDFRLTLTTGTPVTTADVTAAGTIYWAPIGGYNCALYDGSVWNLRTSAEISLALTATSGKPYDVFVYDNAGTPTLETLVWTNDTTRATALTTQNGVLVKTGATTRRYVGSFYATGANVTEDSFAKRNLWNYYNRVPRVMRRIETTDTWAYNGVFQQANAAAANQLEFILGWAEVPVEAYVVSSVGGNASATSAWVAIGEDSTTTADANCLVAWSPILGNLQASLQAQLKKYPAVGRHTWVWLEKASAGTTTWRGDNGADGTQSGIHGVIPG